MPTAMSSALARNGTRHPHSRNCSSDRVAAWWPHRPGLSQRGVRAAVGLLRQQFSTRMRYSGSSLADQFAAILGGMAPLICTVLVAITGSVYSVAAFVIVLAMVSFACSYLMTENCAPEYATMKPSRWTAAAPNHPLQAGPGSREHVPQFQATTGSV